MSNPYATIIRDNLRALYAAGVNALSTCRPAKKEDDRFVFHAFGDRCVISPTGITRKIKRWPTPWPMSVNILQKR